MEPTTEDDAPPEVVYEMVEVPTDPASYTDPDERPALPKMLSPSRMDDFGTCPRQYFYKSILRLPTEPSIAAAKGTVAHQVLETLFELPRAERTVEAAVGGIDAAWEACLSDDYHAETMGHLFDNEADPDAARAEFFADVRRFVENYFTIENPTRFDPESCERWVRGWISGHGYVGVIDRLDRIKFPDGTEGYFVSDYKTGRMPRLNQYAGDKFNAMRIYAVLLQEELGEMPKRLRLVYIGEPGRDRVLNLDVTEEMLANTRSRMKAVSAAVKRAYSRWEWPARKNRLCDWCDFQEICPAVGGALAGMPVTVRRKVDTPAPAAAAPATQTEGVSA